MSLTQYCERHMPPQQLIDHLRSVTGVFPRSNQPVTKMFQILMAASFVHWLKSNNGERFSYGLFGVQPEHPGLWERVVATGLDSRGGNIELDNDLTLFWTRCRPLQLDKAPSDSWVYLRQGAKSYGRFIAEMSPYEAGVVKGTLIPEPMAGLVPADLAGDEDVFLRVFFKGVAHALSSWLSTEVGAEWMFHGGPFPVDPSKGVSILAAMARVQGEVVSYRSGANTPFTPLLPPVSVERFDRQSDTYCDSCYDSQPCIQRVGSQNLCSHCRGYEVSTSGAHRECERCDRGHDHPDRCSHWGNYFASHGHRALLPAPM